MIVHAQAIITQLVFEHSLRIRMKAEVPESSASTPDKPVINTNNLVGKINNLVSTDLQNITEARNILLIGASRLDTFFCKRSANAVL